MRRRRDGPLCSTARHGGRYGASPCGGREPDRRVGADVARQGQRKAGRRPTSGVGPSRSASCRARLRRSTLAGCLRAALPQRAGNQAPARRASRALEVVEKAFTGQASAQRTGALHGAARVMQS
jgi:hypothetical protein